MDGVEKHDLAIIGGGMSGIATAHHLIVKKGYKGKLIILEARNRIGGRIWTRDIDGFKVEMGANWIHGIQGNPIFQLAVDNKLVSPDNIESYDKDGVNDLCVRTTKGDEVDLDKFKRVYETYAFLLRECEQLFISNSSSRSSPRPTTNSPSKASVGEYLDSKIKDHVSTLKEPEKSLTQAIFDTLINRETVISACDSMDECSLQYFGAYKTYPGGDCTIPGGYDQIIKAMIDEITARDVEKKVTLKLNTQVTRVHWSDDDINVLCLSGVRLKCSQCVITLPLGVLKKHHQILFDPPLPNKKIDAIMRLGFGTVDKIFLEYENSIADLIPFREMYTIWLPEERSRASWAGKMYSFTKVNDKILLAWLSGKEAVAVEKMQLKEIMKVCTNYLRKFLKNPKFPKPKKAYVNLWGNDPYSMGSYTFISRDSSDKDILALAEPVVLTSETRLIFAGEACHPCFFSTVHGAYLSGEQAADHVKLVEKDCDSVDTIFMSEFDGKLAMNL